MKPKNHSSCRIATVSRGQHPVTVAVVNDHRRRGSSSCIGHGILSGLGAGRGIGNDYGNSSLSGS